MLSIRVGHHFYSIPSKKITHIEYVDILTTLPFTPSPIEGLVSFNAQPVLQINVASALAVAQTPQQRQKKLIVNTKQGHFALRVDDVSRLTTTNDIPKLDLHALLPRIIATKPFIAPSPPKESPHPSIEEQKLTGLLVVSGEKTIALLTHNIDHIEEIGVLPTLTEQESPGELLIKWQNQLITTHSLAHLLHLKNPPTEPLAVIVRGKKTTWALLVQRVIGMETIGQVYSSDQDKHGLCAITPAQRLHELIDDKNLSTRNDSILHFWYVTKADQLRELFNADSLLANNYVPQNIRMSAPQTAPRLALVINKTSSSQGLRVFCGDESYLLPLSMAARVMDSLDLSTLTQQRFPATHRANHRHQIPWINANAWLFYKDNEAVRTTVAINLPHGGQLLLGVDRAQLSQSLSACEDWINVNLPYPLTLFFDAACYDASTKKWVLRFINTIQFANLPWTLKKALAKAIIGWFDHR